RPSRHPAPEPEEISVKSRGVVSLWLLPGGGWWSGGEGEPWAGGLGVVLEGVDELAHGDVGEVAAFAVLPFLVLFLEDGADEAGHAVAVGEDLDDVGAAFDLPVQAFDGVVRPDFLPVLAWHRRESGQVCFGGFEHRGDLGER